MLNNDDDDEIKGKKMPIPFSFNQREKRIHTYQKLHPEEKSFNLDGELKIVLHVHTSTFVDTLHDCGDSPSVAFLYICFDTFPFSILFRRFSIFFSLLFTL